MTSKILVADDSLTIQKVINITLANIDSTLVECLSDEDLISKVSNDRYDLILLDFNLSENRSGYELASIIKKNHAHAPIIVMLGTFDSVDESKFKQYGIVDKIVKPFESSKFIKKCQDALALTDNSSELNLENINTVEEVAGKGEEQSDLNIDAWTVDTSSSEIEFAAQEEVGSDPSPVVSENMLDPLKSEIQGWGFEVEETGEDLEEKFNKSFPPVISNTNTSNMALEKLQASSAFILENDNLEDETDYQDATEPEFQLPEDLNRDLLKEVDEEVSVDSFWAVDEVVPVSADDTIDLAQTHLDDVTGDIETAIESFKEQQLRFDAEEKPSVTSTLAVSSTVDMDELVRRLKLALMPEVELMVKEYCKEAALKVSWEVIPDLAENLIKKEIKEISDSIH